MKLLTYHNRVGEEHVGILINDKVLDPGLIYEDGDHNRTGDLISHLLEHENRLNRLHELSLKIQRGELEADFLELSELQIQAPLPRPGSLRDAYAFRTHVETARRNRGLEMIPEFDRFPVFYFGNHRQIIGPGDVRVEADHLEGLDFELEIAAVIGRRGKNLSPDEADECIAGFTIMNDFSARGLQIEEMRLNLGPAKGKDFATALGPWLVTPEDLEDFRRPTPPGSAGRVWSLEMCARHNGLEVSRGNFLYMHWTFAEIISRVSYGAEIFPGDVIGSGTVGTGCFLELNGSGARLAKTRGQDFTPTWLKVGDEIELEVQGLGILKNRIVKNEESSKIFQR